MDNDVKFVDCFGDMCPIPLLKIEKQLQTVKAGESFMIATDHSCVVESIKEKYRRSSLDITINEVMNGVWEITFTKL